MNRYKSKYLLHRKYKAQGCIPEGPRILVVKEANALDTKYEYIVFSCSERQETVHVVLRKLIEMKRKILRLLPRKVCHMMINVIFIKKSIRHQV